MEASSAVLCHSTWLSFGDIHSPLFLGEHVFSFPISLPPLKWSQANQIGTRNESREGKFKRGVYLDGFWIL